MSLWDCLDYTAFRGETGAPLVSHELLILIEPRVKRVLDVPLLLATGTVFDVFQENAHFVLIDGVAPVKLKTLNVDLCKLSICIEILLDGF